MAMIVCPECKNAISDRAAVCPHCGCPVEISKVSFEENYNASQPNSGMSGPQPVNSFGQPPFNNTVRDFQVGVDVPTQPVVKDPIYKKGWFWIAIVIGLLLIGGLGGSSDKTKETQSDGPADGIEIGYASYEIAKGNYKDCETKLRNKGFTNITTEPVADLKIGLLAKEYEVASVSIAGNTSFKKTTRAHADDLIVIRYHTYPEGNSSDDNPDTRQGGTENNKSNSGSVVGLNEEFGNNTITAMVVSADLDYKGYYDLWTEVPEGYKAILLVIKMTNISKDRNYVSVGDFSCYVDNVAVSAELISGSNYDYNENIDPGRAAMLGACYIIPKNAQSIELQYTPIGEKKDKTIIKIQ